MTKKDNALPYREVPYDWMVARQGGEIRDRFFGFNKKTGERLPLRDTYGEALQDVHKVEPAKK